MCGRYNIASDAEGFIDAFEITAGLQYLPNEPLYNIAPSTAQHETRVPIVRVTTKGRELALARWPLVPHWAGGRAVPYNTANAKGETLEDKPAYRGPWRMRRCLIPASGYYEWQIVPSQRWKQPYHIRLRDENLFGFGGLWEHSFTEQRETVESCTIVTTTPSESIRHIHSRMPLIIPREGYDDWLTGTTAEAARWIQPYPADLLEAYPVSTYVNNPMNKGRRCLERGELMKADQGQIF
jgi:putative SOS response-associated peptidase YedK